MHTTQLADLGKIWIPRTLWFGGEPAIARYVALQGLSADLALRFALVDGKTYNELFIPSTIVADASSYGIYAQCYASIAELNAGMTSDNYVTAGATVDYTTSTFAGAQPASST
jgi:hypothetical protein